MTETRKRARDLGLKIGILEPGPFNAITDVKGVRVGHANVRHGEVPGGYGKGPAITGVTAIIPDDDLGRGAVPAGRHVLNGTGEVTGISEIEGIGRIDTPIMLTNTMGVGIVYDATCRWVIENDPEVVARGGTAIPIVGECNDGSLNDAHGMHVRAEHAGGHRFSKLRGEFRNEAIKRGRGLLGPRGMGVARSIAARGVGVQRELRHRENRATDVDHATVHFAYLVIEDAQLHKLVDHAIFDRFGVGMRDANEHQEAVVDLTSDALVNGDACLGNTLNK